MQHFTKIGFTLIEVLIVIMIIAILASLLVSVTHNLQIQSARSRARGEIAAIAVALENYKSDYGDYPSNSVSNSTNLVLALMTENTRTHKAYYEFKLRSLSNNIFLDPFGNAYNYIYTNAAPNNGTNNYDLWSTGGEATNSQLWIKNW